MECYKWSHSTGSWKENWYSVLYMISSPRDTIAITEVDTNASLWHFKLGHMSEKWMRMHLSKGILLELNSIDFNICEKCILGK